MNTQIPLPLGAHHHPVLDYLFAQPLTLTYVLRRCYRAALLTPDGLVPDAVRDRERRSFPYEFARLVAAGLLVERPDGRVELAPLPTASRLPLTPERIER